MQSVETFKNAPKPTFLSVDEAVENRSFSLLFIHTLQKIHILHILSTMEFHKMWIFFAFAAGSLKMFERTRRTGEKSAHPLFDILKR